MILYLEYFYIDGQLIVPMLCMLLKLLANAPWKTLKRKTPKIQKFLKYFRSLSFPGYVFLKLLITQFVFPKFSWHRRIRYFFLIGWNLYQKLTQDLIVLRNSILKFAKSNNVQLRISILKVFLNQVENI